MRYNLVIESKNSTNVTLLGLGNGLWDKIWTRIKIDKESKEIVQIEFDHRGETPS